MNSSFLYPPNPQILHWLAASQLANRLQRAVRLWVLLSKLYGSESHWANELPSKFTYPDLRFLLFATSHPTSDAHGGLRLGAKNLTYKCNDRTCICHQSLKDWIFTPETQQIESEWLSQVITLTGITPIELERQLHLCPFATVHRSIRDDLKQLAKLGWLHTGTNGQYQCRLAKEWPTPSPTNSPAPTFAHLSLPQTWEVLRVLEAVSFVQPNLEIVVRSLWEQVTDITSQQYTEPTQRIFLNLDYILSDEMQEQVDTYQEQIEQLWYRSPGGVIQFEYWLAASERRVKIITYPVCLHYLRRAKYMSAYGFDPDNKLGWHNYRLDRITSKRLNTLPWGDPKIPKELKHLYTKGSLPTPEYVKNQLEEAWGFNFYLPRQLLIIRFPRPFARWYVDNTVRHPTFEPVAYQQLPQLIKSQVSNPQQQKTLLQIIKERSVKDSYYQAWIRQGDVNVMMRLREWRPNGEVIAPLSIRQRLMEEATQELSNYSLGSQSL